MTTLQRGKNPDPFVSENFSLKSDKNTRLKFVYKVYGILSAQLAFTSLMVLGATLNADKIGLHHNHVVRSMFNAYHR